MTSLVPWDLWDPFDVGSVWPVWDTSRHDRGREDGGGGGALARTVPVDWCETPNAHIIRVDVPGVKREEVMVHVEDGNVLELQGEKAKEDAESGAGDTWHRRERRKLSFRRRFRLPENANMDAVHCSLAYGVLTVTVPKKETGGGERKVRAIEIS
ncbi:hypothetical protein Taro_020511 [Colocasia esculenta]|uniref:SHSP domain-containing protein n=1 Tax=Colocasia esculenta TaxID=4460 RepID=A0A843V8P4_COLES|nr:hypothetical protein [Colocasia esculenta]